MWWVCEKAKARREKIRDGGTSLILNKGCIKIKQAGGLIWGGDIKWSPDKSSR